MEANRYINMDDLREHTKLAIGQAARSSITTAHSCRTNRTATPAEAELEGDVPGSLRL
jgi:hypothetical protein